MKEIKNYNKIFSILFTLFSLYFFYTNLITFVSASSTYTCKSITVKQGDKETGFFRDGGSLRFEFVLTLTSAKSNENVTNDLTFAYDKGWRAWDMFINDKVVPIDEFDVNSTDTEKKVYLTIPNDYIKTNKNESEFKAGIFPNIDCNQGELGTCRVPIKTVDNKNCEITAKVFNINPEDNSALEGNCTYNQGQYNAETEKRFTCTKNINVSPATWSGSIDSAYPFGTACSGENPNLEARSCNAKYEEMGSATEWCVPCPSELEPLAPGEVIKSKAGEECNFSSTSPISCNKDILECKKVSSEYIGTSLYDINKCVYIRPAGEIGEYCIVGSNQCKDRLFCLGSDTLNTENNYKFGSEGTCKNVYAELDKDFIDFVIPCNYQEPSSCDQFLTKPQLSDYKVARCVETINRVGYCNFSIEINGDMAKLNAGIESTTTIIPVIPAPPSRFIERCKGDLSCANCVARDVVVPADPKADPPVKATYQPFSTYADAAATEYTYNQEVDKWKQGQLDDGDYTQAPTPTEFVYTGYIYTSLGCLDTTDNGLITRVVQIALGIIGSVILVRFAQAALKLQGGSSPEDKAEGIEIVTSAIVALLLFVMSMIVLRFIGVDLFQIFSPGSFEIG